MVIRLTALQAIPVPALALVPVVPFPVVAEASEVGALPEAGNATGNLHSGLETLEDIASRVPLPWI